MALAQRGMYRGWRPVVFGSLPILTKLAKRFAPKVTLVPVEGESYPHLKANTVGVQDVSTKENVAIEPGKLSAEAGRLAGRAIEEAVRFVLRHRLPALVTAPVNKQNLSLAGYRFTGHTEYLAQATGVADSAMFFVTGDVKVVCVTTHIPLAEVTRVLTPELIERKILLAADALRNYFGLKRPRVALCGINPHAGDGGLLGSDEAGLIEPVIRRLSQRGMAISGPYSADSVFLPQVRRKFDLIAAMYHDQGMIPVKLLGRGRAVNITLGLPFVRTSPAFGSAFDIAGKGQADAAGMVAAIRWAVRLGEIELRRWRTKSQVRRVQPITDR